MFTHYRIKGVENSPTLLALSWEEEGDLLEAVPAEQVFSVQALSAEARDVLAGIYPSDGLTPEEEEEKAQYLARYGHLI